MSGPVTSVARVEDVQIFLKDPVYSDSGKVLKMGAAGSSEMFVPVYQITLRHILNECDPNHVRQNHPSL